ncbi:fibronectin type III domain-containing protein 7-like [Paramisgurnus dabryanus]|uniref:fibronectin type III domain-containing protein 7-like n=1 Tax=Paramisgurnus dabryanus TaxID=90735 RepID=UPI0031F426D7
MLLDDNLNKNGISSVPCGPAQVHAEVQCPSGVLSMSWNRTEDAGGYTTSIVSVSTGEQVYCNSTEPFCSVSALQCGESYSVQVRSYNGTCLSMPTESLVIKEVPCVPTDVILKRMCANSSVEVSWNGNYGAQSYVAIAVDDSGNSSKCYSNTTTCSFTNPRCSSVYFIRVRAVNNNCSSLESQNVTLHTVPCPPTNVQSSLNCSTNSISVSWDASISAVSYRGRAVGEDGHSVTCDVSSPACQLNDLHCGQVYVITIISSDGTCDSPNSQEHRHKTEIPKRVKPFNESVCLNPTFR